MIWYTVRTITPNTYRIIKLDEELNLIKSKPNRYYHIVKHTIDNSTTPPSEKWHCSCDQFYKFNICRHVFLVKRFQSSGRINSGWLHEYDFGRWKAPLPPEGFPRKIIKRQTTS